MTSKTTKITLLLALYTLAHFAQACWDICDCPKVEFPYFDYKELQVSTNDPNADSYLSISLKPDSIDLVAQASPGFSLMSSAYACSCIGDGEEGDKYAPVSVDIFADRAFNDTLPAGTSLRSIFRGATQGDILDLLSAPAFKPNRFAYFNQTYSITTNIRPKQTGESYHFQIQWVKSNGDTINVATEAVVFN